ncbi:MAG: uracil-DNA glycosylase family protein [Candidatus Pelagadaptatus aseana]|uniref:uracil-DNA glycosylase family protein n=1 Tax=Candidatus Pelagadaptatus aseana TaxID=3120508 RepID=UPI0039B236B7
MVQLIELLDEISACKLCEPHLALGANPVVRAHSDARILIIGQAPGTRVHTTGIPWNDPSGDRLRQWLAVDRDSFYDDTLFAIMPMGFCYPGKGKSGDLPPRPECAPTWHDRLMAHLPNIELTLLIGQYAQKHYLQDHHKNLTERVKHWRDHITNRREGGIQLPLPHPSPRNRLWLQRNDWFETETVPWLQQHIKKLLHSSQSGR